MLWIFKQQKQFKENEIYMPSPSIDQKLVVMSINKMFESNKFDICVFHNIRDTFNVVRTRKDLFERLRMLHCMDWNMMDKETYQFVIDATKELIKTWTLWETHEKPFFTINDFKPW